MAIRVRFYDSLESKEITFLECKKITPLNVIGICIEDSSGSIPILLDKQSCVRLVRELRKLISELD